MKTTFETMYVVRVGGKTVDTWSTKQCGNDHARYLRSRGQDAHCRRETVEVMLPLTTIDDLILTNQEC